MKEDKNSKNSEPLAVAKLRFEDPHIKQKIDSLLLILNSSNYKETLLDKIKNLYITEFEDRISFILTEKAEDFLITLNLRVRRILEDLYTEQCFNYDSEIFNFKSLNLDFNEIMKKQEEYIKKEKFQPNYKTLSAGLLIYESKLISTSRKNSSKSAANEVFPYMRNFTRHCKNSIEALHPCGEKLIEVSNGKTTATHLLCLKCKKGYLPSCVLLYCETCNVEYFSSLSKRDYKSQHLQPATWVKYHCGAIINDQMKCIQCREVFHFNCETSILECLNPECLLKADPLSIRWKCMICKDEFKSGAKIYNPLEFKKIKNAIKDTIIDRCPARPKLVTCSCGSEINSKIENIKFFHKKECNGELYLGKMDGRDIVVCERCRSMNFYDKYIWTCPLCFKRFQQKFEKIQEKEIYQEKNNIQNIQNPGLVENGEEKNNLSRKNSANFISNQETPEKSNPHLKRHYSQYKVFDHGHGHGQTKPFTAIFEEDEETQKLEQQKISNKNEPIVKSEIPIVYARSETPNSYFESPPRKLISPFSTLSKNEEGTQNTQISQNKLDSNLDFTRKKANSSNLINLNFNQENSPAKPYSQLNFINNPINVQGSGNININVNINIKKSLTEEFNKDELESKSISTTKETSSQISQYSSNKASKALSPIASSRNVVGKHALSSSSKLNMANLINFNQKQSIKSNEKIEKIEKIEKNENQIPVNYPQQDESNTKINSCNYISNLNCQMSKINLEDFKVMRQIGEGSFGKIYLVEEITTKNLFAMKKIIAHTRDEIEGFKTEYELMNFIGGNTKDSILRIYGIATKELDGTTFALYVLMELADSDWEKEIQYRNKERIFYTEDELLRIVKKVVIVLASLQRDNISHRDIKPQNILIFYPLCEKIKQKDKKNPIYKIADFGEAKEVNMKNQQKELNTLRGTELYMSPILFTSLRNSGKTSNDIIDSENFKITHDSFKSDVFSFGYCVLLAATLNYRALYDIRELGDMQSTSKVIYNYLKSRYSNKLINIIIKMVEINENIRPDFIQLEEKFL